MSKAEARKGRNFYQFLGNSRLRHWQRGRGDGVETEEFGSPLHHGLNGQTMFGAQVVHGAGVLDELVRPADAEDRGKGSN